MRTAARCTIPSHFYRLLGNQWKCSHTGSPLCIFPYQQKRLWSKSCYRLKFYVVTRLKGVLYFENIIRFHGACMTVIASTPRGNVRPLLRRFLWKSLGFNSNVRKIYISNSTHSCTAVYNFIVTTGEVTLHFWKFTVSRAKQLHGPEFFLRRWELPFLLSNPKILSLESFCTRPSSDAPSSQGISGGDGDNKEDTSNRSHRKRSRLL